MDDRKTIKTHALYLVRDQASSLVLKVFKGPLSCLKLFLATESPLKIMKNAFYFTLKDLSFLGYLNFCSHVFGLVGKRFDKKVRLISNLMTSQTGKQTITIYILAQYLKK